MCESNRESQNKVMLDSESLNIISISGLQNGSAKHSGENINITCHLPPFSQIYDQKSVYICNCNSQISYGVHKYLKAIQSPRSLLSDATK
jgi:hypothetical protein